MNVRRARDIEARSVVSVADAIRVELEAMATAMD